MATAPSLSAALVAFGALALLSGCGGDGPPEPRQAADSTVGGTVRATSSPAPSATSSPPPSAPPTGPSPATPDGVLYAFLVAFEPGEAEGYTMRYDKMDYRQQECEALAQPADPDRAFDVCFSNVNPLIRSVPVSPEVEILGAREDGPAVELAPDELLPFLISERNPFGPELTALEVTVTGGQVTRIEQFVLSYA